jgi:DNA-binding response OmpR family regulator
LSEVEEAVARTLTERFGEVVDAATLAASTAPPLSPTGVRVHIMRLRERIKPLGLNVRTVRRHGYVLDVKPAPENAGS